MNRTSAFARPAPAADSSGSGAPLTRRQLRELAEAQAASEAAAQVTQAEKWAAASAASGTVTPAAPRQAESPQAESPLSRRELRERAVAAQRAAEAQNTQTVAPSQVGAIRPVPAVQPPAATGAIRALDQTGQLTPVRRVSMTSNQGQGQGQGQGQASVPRMVPSPAQPIQSAPGGDFSRVGVRESLAQVQAEATPRVYPGSGVTPKPAVPTGQRTALSSNPATENVWAQVSQGAPRQAPAAVAPVSPTAPANAPASAAATSWSASGWQPVAPAQAAASTPSAVTSRSASAPAAAAPVASASGVASAEGAQDYGPGVPAWGAVSGAEPNAGAPNFGPAPVAPPQADPRNFDADDDFDDESDSWLKYTPLQFLVLIVLGLVLGGLVWQLLNATGSSSANEAQAATSQVQVDNFEQSDV